MERLKESWCIIAAETTTTLQSQATLLSFVLGLVCSKVKGNQRTKKQSVMDGLHVENYCHYEYWTLIVKSV